MGLLDELLRDLAHPPGPTVAPSPPTDALERWSAAWVRAALHATGRAARDAHRVLSDADLRSTRLRSAWAHAIATGGSVWSEVELVELVEEAVWRSVTEEPTPGWRTRVEFVEAEIRALAHSVGGRASFQRRDYLEAVGATDRAGRRLPFGDLLLTLGPRDAVVALLVAEVMQSTGDDDAYRYTRWALAYVNDHRQCDWNAPDPDWQPLPSLGRLVAFGIVDADLESGHEWVRPDRAAWLEAAITEPPTALAALVRATLDDRTAQVVGSSQGAPAAVRELAETVAHELGNVVGAMDLTLRALAPDLPAGDRRLARLVGSTAKLQRFAQSLRELLPTGYEPPAPHGLLSIVMDCLDETEAERNGHLRVQLRVDEVLLVVPRRRLVLALVQLVRNAAQAVATRPGLLVVSTAIHADRVELWFEDDGPGVPPAVEGRIWERGVSGRGGSGLGLALVRDVVERELLGSVTHEHRAPTGARFVLSLPFAAETP